MSESADPVAPSADAGWATDPTDVERLGSGALTVLAPSGAPPYDPWCDDPTFLRPRKGD